MSDLDKLAADLRTASRKAPEMADKAIRKGGLDVVRIAKSKAPVDTGALRNSIGMESLGLAKVEVGPTVHYAPYQEYGTSRMPAQPYMHPAVNEVEPVLAKALSQVGYELLIT